MATRRAVANGNWSATATWNGGVVPGNGDTVYANGWNITIDQHITIGGINNPSVNAGSFVAGQYYRIEFVGTTSWTAIGATSNTAGTIFLATGSGSGTGTATALATIATLANTPAGASAGGNFVISTAYTLNCDIRAGTTACLTISGAGSMTLSGLNIIAGAATGANAITNNSTGTIALNSGANIVGGTSNAHCINNINSGSIAVSNCIITGGGNSSGSCLNNSANGSIIVASSTLTGGNSGNAVGTCINNASTTGTITVTDSAVVGGNNCFSITNTSTGSLTVSASTITAGTFNSNSAGINNASTGTLIATGCTFTASAFANAVSIGNTSADVRLSGDFLDHWSGWKAVSGGKWRLGTTPTAARTRYALAGTTDSYVEMFTADNTGFGLPAANHVRSGISYGGGAVTGTCAVPSPSAVAFSVPVDNTTGTAILTQANVQSALTAQGLTSARAGNLDNLDAAVSSRLAPSGTLATVTTLTNAPASVTASDIWSHPARTITGGTVDTLTNAPTVPSASAIASQVRTELSPELAKVSALNTTRLAQVSTTEIVGNLLAQANS